eukprot:TRINITY_DN42726_c0_g1_i1.p1 TRINITY_DN42726_c0_g1~~TRINITY_DN42726_c0_g1_i1.p1  ORF type:complete len:455 (+),score=106.23 TRINITY_DN42726_c0_g1_i1:89-1366(+)
MERAWRRGRRRVQSLQTPSSRRTRFVLGSDDVLMPSSTQMQGSNPLRACASEQADVEVFAKTIKADQIYVQEVIDLAASLWNSGTLLAASAIKSPRHREPHLGARRMLRSIEQMCCSSTRGSFRHWWRQCLLQRDLEEYRNASMRIDSIDVEICDLDFDPGGVSKDIAAEYELRAITVKHERDSAVSTERAEHCESEALQECRELVSDMHALRAELAEHLSNAEEQRCEVKAEADLAEVGLGVNEAEGAQEELVRIMEELSVARSEVGAYAAEQARAAARESDVAESFEAAVAAAEAAETEHEATLQASEERRKELSEVPAELIAAQEMAERCAEVTTEERMEAIAEVLREELSSAAARAEEHAAREETFREEIRSAMATAETRLAESELMTARLEAVEAETADAAEKKELGNSATKHKQCCDLM